MFKTLRDDIAACMSRDPAARSPIEVLLAYPGFHAVLFYRIASWFWRRRMFILGRWISHWGRFLTGIEIHPGARIGHGFFIDHGTGVVIGETAEVGDNVTLYHDVTLGGLLPSVDSDGQRNRKRHPTLEDDVIVGSGAQILGPITVHRGGRVGANSVVLKDVPAGTTVVGIPARIAGRARNEEEAARFAAYGMGDELSDPVQRITDALLDKVQSLSMRVEELERQRDEDRAALAPPSLDLEGTRGKRDETR